MSLSTSTDFSTFEATLFRDHAVNTIRSHAASHAQSPMFLYMAFHNEHDPHQSPKEVIDKFETVRSDTYKITAALVPNLHRHAAGSRPAPAQARSTRRNDCISQCS